jgi:acetyl-CoA carboxylase carboxyltransferase component
VNAQELLSSVEAAKQAVIDRIAELRTNRAAIDEELTVLGAKRVRKPSKKLSCQEILAYCSKEKENHAV